MSFVVLAYPKLAEKDLAFIQSVRAEQDELYYSVVEPHFTIVFPVASVPREVFLEHVRVRIGEMRKFDFMLRCAVLEKDAFNDYTHVFLVPDEGYSRVVRLHDALYTGLLAKELRLDLPFIPHIGVANSKDTRHCKSIADTLNQMHFQIPGLINELTVAEFTNNVVTPIQRIALR